MVVLQVLVEVTHRVDHQVLVRQGQRVVLEVQVQLRTLEVLLVLIPQVSLR